ncbi:MAG: Stp1/IreP family PP2C-type Ser/Thr phosphatase [Bacteriovoracaceae bacterium]
MPILSSGLCDIGRKRKTNQDAIYLNPEKKLFVVADGMGGHNGGDIASAMAVKYIPSSLLSKSSINPIEGSVNSVLEANRLIKEKGQTDAKLSGMGTTVVSLFFHKGIAYITNVGDSRAYLVHDHMLYQMTRDHSLVQEKLNVGIYSRTEAKNDPNKNVLVRTVGFDDDVEIDVFTYKVCRNDIFLTCSDGLSSKVSDEDIIYIVNKMLPDPSTATQKDIDATVKRLVDLANENGGQDNISVILVLAR